MNGLEIARLKTNGEELKPKAKSQKLRAKGQRSREQIKDIWQQQQRSPRRTRNPSSPPSTGTAARSADGRARTCASSASAVCASVAWRSRVKCLGCRRVHGNWYLAIGIWLEPARSKELRALKGFAYQLRDNGLKAKYQEPKAGLQYVTAGFPALRDKRVTIRGEKRR
jgi:hypothetical protein